MCEHYHPMSVDSPTIDLDRNPSLVSRRAFMQGTFAIASTTLTMPGFLAATSAQFNDTTMRLSSTPGGAEDRILVIVQLSGGNDGLNTVIPYGDSNYYRQRPGIGIDKNEVIGIDRNQGIGLHPAMRPIAEMISENLAAIVQGVGYPNPNRSHFSSMDIWHTADLEAGARGGRGVGWIGRAMDEAYRNGKRDMDMASIAIGSRAPLALSGRHVRPVSFERADLFRWLGSDFHDKLERSYEALAKRKVEQADIQTDAAAFVQRIAGEATVASDKVRKAVSKQPSTSFPGTSLGKQLRLISSMINAQLPTRVYYAAHGGFDTHAGQAGRHNSLLEQFAEAMRAFYKEMKATGHASRVLTVAFSEFGRRVRQNASGGTDHGAAGPMFLFGDQIKSGLHGRHPSLTDLDKGDLIYKIDFRSIYADILRQWMKLPMTITDSASARTPAGVLPWRVA